MISPEMIELIQMLGVPAVISLIFAITFARVLEANTKQDNTLTSFSVEFNEERKKLQQEQNRISAELVDLKVLQGKEEGRREQMEKSHERERSEWKVERNEFSEQIRKMEVRVFDLEKDREQSKQRISELEAQVDHLNKKIAEREATIAKKEKTISEKDEMINTLEAQKDTLSNTLEKERNRADSLSDLVTRLQDSIKSDDGADDTITPLNDNGQEAA